MAQKIGAKDYMECSSRTGQGVREVFQRATRAALLVSCRLPLYPAYQLLIRDVPVKQQPSFQERQEQMCRALKAPHVP
jgi:hypothetical protein